MLRVRSELWKELGKQLKKLGVDLPILEQVSMMNKNNKKRNFEPVPLNKVGDYYEGEDGNMTIPIDFKGQQTLAILDSGGGVDITTKRIWESWGKPAIKKIRMKLQLADGYIERPIGLLEKVVVSSCVG